MHYIFKIHVSIVSCPVANSPVIEDTSRNEMNARNVIFIIKIKINDTLCLLF